MARHSHPGWTGALIVALVTLVAALPRSVLAAPDLSVTFAEPAVTIAPVCDLSKPLAFINLVATNRGDAPTTDVRIWAADVKNHLDGQVVVPPIAPGGRIGRLLPLAAVPGSQDAIVSGTRYVTVTAGARTIGTVPVSFPTKLCAGLAPSSAPRVLRPAAPAPAAVSNVGVAGNAGITAPTRPPVTTTSRRILPQPDPPTGLKQAGLAECDTNPAVRAVTGGSADACRHRLVTGGTVLYWDNYRQADCTDAACFIGSYRLYDYRTKGQVTTVNGESQTAALIPGAALGDCYVVRAYRHPNESHNSRLRCVTVLRTTKQLMLGPTLLGQFQAMAHDNHDHGYCTRHSWDSAWASEPYGFVVHSRELKLDPQAPFDSLRLTIGYNALLHPGTEPLPCPEGLVHVWRGYLTFAVPAEARQSNAKIVFAFTPAGQAGAITQCFHYLWRPHHWFYNQGQGYSPTIGINDGKMLEPGKDPLGLLQLADGRASFDLSGNAGLHESGTISVALAAFQDGIETSEIAHPTMFQGRYFVQPGNVTCGVNAPHLEIGYVLTQTIPTPNVIQAEKDWIEVDRNAPSVLPDLRRVRPAPSPTPLAPN